VFDSFAKQQTFYILSFVLFYPFAILIFFASLQGAHKKMVICKLDVFKKLGNTFDFYYIKLNQASNQKIYEINTADEISRIHSLYQIAEKMPVWPFDKESIKRAFSALAIPALVFIYDLITNTDSVLYNLNKAKDMFRF